MLATLVAIAFVIAQPTPAVAWNECASCHLRLAWTQSRITHVDEWITSTHALHRVGCEQCHEGDATTADQAAAHRAIRNSADERSTVHRSALPETCGRCHMSETAAFARSMHRELLAHGDATVPTCTSCHTSMAADVPSPAGLERQCRHCHGSDPQDRAGITRRQLEEVARLRAVLTRARFEIAGIATADRRTALAARWHDADLSLRTVVAGVHAFDQRRVEDRLSDARAQIARLTSQLAR